MALLIQREGYNVSTSRFGLIACYDFAYQPARQANSVYEIVISSANGWHSGTTMTTSFPFFITQLFVSNLTYRILFYLCRPLSISRFTAQILTGVFASVMGYTEFFEKWIFPYRFTMVLETFANYTVVYHMFLVGLEMDLSVIRRSRVRSLSIAVAGFIVPLGVGAALYFKLKDTAKGLKNPSGAAFWAIALAATNFPELGTIVADLKLLRTDMAQTAMSAAVATDLGTWFLLVITLLAFNKEGDFNKLTSYAVLSVSVFIFFCIFVLRPSISWIINKTTKRGKVSENQILFILIGVMVCGLITDACGSHSLVGAFMLGVIMPKNHVLRSILTEKLEDLMSGILMPLFFIVSGLRIDWKILWEFTDYRYLVLVLCLSFSVKIVSTFFVSLFHGIPFRDGLAIGLLMNSKGVLALIIVNAGRDTRALDNITYSIMVLAMFVMSTVVQPLMALGYKPKKVAVDYENRTIQRMEYDSELSILVCIHNMEKAPGIAKLLQVSNPTNLSPLRVFLIHLVELTGRTTASMLIMSNENKRKGHSVHDDRTKSEADQIVDVFRNLEQISDAVKVQTIKAVSSYTTMHEDICSLAEDKSVSFIILPYHRKLTADGKLGEGNSSHANINRRVLSHAPCSVGILVDRGMNDVDVLDSSIDVDVVLTHKKVVMLFIGGPDDREALTYAWRMAGDPSVNLTVVRFVPGREAITSSHVHNNSSDDETSSEHSILETTWHEIENQIDDEYIYEFTYKTSNDPSVDYMEKVVNDAQETINVIKSLEAHNYDLYIVGRGHGVKSPLVEVISDWNSSPELGSIGDTLASSSFSLHASVLVIQQYSATNRITFSDQKLSYTESSSSWKNANDIV